MWRHTTRIEDHGSHRVKVGVWTLDFAHVYRCRIETGRGGFKLWINQKSYPDQGALEEAQRYLETVVELELRAVGEAWREFMAQRPPRCSWCATPIKSDKARRYGLCESHAEQFMRNVEEPTPPKALPPNVTPFRQVRKKNVSARSAQGGELATLSGLRDGERAIRYHDGTIKYRLPPQRSEFSHSDSNARCSYLERSAADTIQWRQRATNLNSSSKRRVSPRIPRNLKALLGAA